VLIPRYLSAADAQLSNVWTPNWRTYAAGRLGEWGGLAERCSSSTSLQWIGRQLQLGRGNLRRLGSALRGTALYAYLTRLASLVPAADPGSRPVARSRSLVV
jgi:hypothetical protein